jgi:predicted CXXCH cytochrome family protein
MRMRGVLLLLGLWLGMAARAAGLVPTALDHAVFAGPFDQPTAVAADGAGRLYVLDGTRDRMVRLSADGKILATFGEARLKRPLDLALAEEGLVVADTGHHRLALFRPDGGFDKALLLPEDPKTGPPEPVAVAVLDGIAFWADRKTHRVCRTRLEDGKALDCFGGRGEKPGEFQYPFQIATDRDGYLNVVDIANARVQAFDRTGRFFSSLGRFGLAAGELYRPNGLAIDRETDTVFVSDGYFGTIAVFRKGEALGQLRDGDGKPVVLDSPTGLSFRDGKLYVAETGGSRVHRYAVAYREGTPPPVVEGKRVEISRKNCVLCHLSWAGEAPAEVRAPDGQGALPEASFRMCYSCHNGPVMDSRKAIHRGAQHPTVYEPAEEKQRHAKARPRQDKLGKEFPATPDKSLLCTACHTPHNNAEHPETLYEAHGNAWLRVPNRGGDLCERCHESKGKGARSGSLSLRERAGVRGDQPGFQPSGTESRSGFDSIGVGGKSQLSSPHPNPLPGGEGEKLEQGLNHPLGIKFAPPPFKDAKGYATNPDLHQGLPQRLAEGGAALGHGNTLICQTCHQVHGGHHDGEMTVLDRNRGELCAECHSRQFSKGDKEAHTKGVHPVNIRRKSEAPGVKPVLWKGKPEIEEVGCETCHRVHKGAAGTPLLPEGASSAKTLCRNCHERQHSDSPEEAHRKGVHPVNVTRKGGEPGGKPPVLWKGKPDITEVTCETCHKVHSGTGETALLPEGIKTAEALCQNCHERQHARDKDEAKRKGVHPVNAKLDEPVEIAGKKVERVGCLTCHAVHKGKPGTAALVESDKEGQLCSHCHKRKQTVVGTDHDLRITARDAKNAHGQSSAESGVCGACHTLHRGKGELPFLAGAKRVQPKPAADPADKMDESPFKRDVLCLNCHQPGGIGEKKVVKHFSHPHEDLVLRSDPKLLPLLGPDEKPADFGRIACVTCHEPHVWDAEKKPPEDAPNLRLSANRENLEGSNRDSFLRHKGVAGTFCVDCHGPEGLVKYKYFHDPKRARNRGLDYLK